MSNFRVVKFSCFFLIILWQDGQFNIASRPSTSTPEEDERNSSPDLPGETQESVKLKWDHFSENKDMV